MNRKQIITGFTLVSILIIFGTVQSAKNPNLGLFLLTGLAIGYVLQRSRYGFGGAIKKPYLTGNITLSKAVLLLFSMTVIGTAAIHYAAHMNGVRSPGIGYVVEANLATVIGGFLFGMGMMFGGGCASGTLTDSGEGEGRGLFVLLFFCIGALWGAYDLPWWKESFFFNGVRGYLPDLFGYFGAIVISLLGYLLIYLYLIKLEAKRKKNGTYIPDSDEKDLIGYHNGKILSKGMYNTLFVKRWSNNAGSALIAILFFIILITTGTSWGVTAVFANWAAWFFNWIGIIDVNNWGYFSTVSKQATLAGGFFNDPGSMRNIGILLGALIAPLLAGNLVFKSTFKPKNLIAYAIGGLCMGYGARIAMGCNVGALLSGLSNMSLSGWVFMIPLIFGGLLGAKITRKLKIET